MANASDNAGSRNSGLNYSKGLRWKVILNCYLSQSAQLPTTPTGHSTLDARMFQTSNQVPDFKAFSPQKLV